MLSLLLTGVIAVKLVFSFCAVDNLEIARDFLNSLFAKIEMDDIVVDQFFTS